MDLGYWFLEIKERGERFSIGIRVGAAAKSRRGNGRKTYARLKGQEVKIWKVVGASQAGGKLVSSGYAYPKSQTVTRIPGGMEERTEDGGAY